MPDRVRIVKHEAVPKCGSYEVRVEGHIPGHRLRPDLLSSERRWSRPDGSET